MARMRARAHFCESQCAHKVGKARAAAEGIGGLPDIAEGLERLSAALRNDGARAAKTRGPAPVHAWNPPFCGDLDMRIAADGTWFYMGTPIGRPALVQLFSTVLKREGGSYFLVTPVEKIGIKVEDVPFVAVEMRLSGTGGSRKIDFRSQVDEWIACGAEHRLRFADGPHGGKIPYLHVRHDEPDALWARISRAVYYDLVAAGEIRLVDGMRMFGLASRGEFFCMCPAADLGDEERVKQASIRP